MRKYDKNLPLIAIHTPKAAGSSCLSIFHRWFGNNFYRHYYQEDSKEFPPKRDLLNLHSPEYPLCVYGHFNRFRQFGVEDYYPDVEQFVTILREPFELMVSGYFFARKKKLHQREPVPHLEQGIKAFLLTRNHINMLNHFPRVVTFDNYKEIIETYFIEIGISEYLDESLHRIAIKLGKPYDPAWLSHTNASMRDEEVPEELRNIMKERHPLEFAVYDYALSQFKNGT